MARHPVAQGFIIAEVPKSHSDKPHSVGFLQTVDRPVAEISTWQHISLTWDRHPRPPLGFEPAIPASERPQYYALDSTVTGICQSDIICANLILFVPIWYYLLCALFYYRSHWRTNSHDRIKNYTWISNTPTCLGSKTQYSGTQAPV